MTYGKGAPVPAAAGVALLPSTGSNDTLFIVAAGLIALGVGVFIVSLYLARKNRQADLN